MSYYTIKGCYRLRSAAAAAAVHAPLRENPGETRDSFLFPAGCRGVECGRETRYS